MYSENDVQSRAWGAGERAVWQTAERGWGKKWRKNSKNAQNLEDFGLNRSGERHGKGLVIFLLAW